MRIDIISREYPPHVYGGAGVHVSELTRALRALDSTEVWVRAFDEPDFEPRTYGYPQLEGLQGTNAAVKTLGVDLAIASACEGTDVVHSHTWYANMAGHWAKLLHDVPHVMSAHSLEPLRPWKLEQLGGGYRISSWAEKTGYLGADAVIAVSHGMRADILRCYPDVDPDRVHVIHNGIDTAQWAPDRSEDAAVTVQKHGIDPERPTVIFVGRITRQKGLPYLVRAIRKLPPEVQMVLCAGAPDTPEILAEVTGLMEELRQERSGIVWITEMLPRNELIALLSASTVFVCPSVYEPLGIVNLEAMACGLPVVGTRTGGIPEVVEHGSTGWLVDIEQVDDGTGTPTDPERFVADLAATLIEAVSDPARARAWGEAGRARAEHEFAWSTIAERTREVYQSVIAGASTQHPASV